MNILIATPLFPPDVAVPAPYVKELARRLSADHKVTVVMYGRLPEALPGVTYVCIDKRQALVVRMAQFFVALLREASRSDVLIVENGPSVEFPVLITTLLMNIPFIFHRSDARAHIRSQHHALLAYIERAVARRARHEIVEMPLQKPEVLPFEPRPLEQENAYNASWAAHLTMLQKLITQTTQDI